MDSLSRDIGLAIDRDVMASVPPETTEFTLKFRITKDQLAILEWVSRGADTPEAMTERRMSASLGAFIEQYRTKWQWAVAKMTCLYHPDRSPAADCSDWSSWLTVDDDEGRKVRYCPECREKIRAISAPAGGTVT